MGDQFCSWRGDGKCLFVSTVITFQGFRKFGITQSCFKIWGKLFELSRMSFSCRSRKQSHAEAFTSFGGKPPKNIWIVELLFAEMGIQILFLLLRFISCVITAYTSRLFPSYKNSCSEMLQLKRTKQAIVPRSQLR